MSDLEWVQVDEIRWTPAPVGSWFTALEFAGGGDLYKFETAGLWHYIDSPSVATPDGHARTSAVRGDAPLKIANVAAVIGKFGGSTADLIPAADAAGLGASSSTPPLPSPFPVGRFCIVKAVEGPLFLAVNLIATRILPVQFTLTTKISRCTNK